MSKRDQNKFKTAVINKRRAAVARTLSTELGMSGIKIGKYLGLHHTSVSHLIRHGRTGPR